MIRFVKLFDRRLIEISGKERGTFLQGLFSQDVAKNFPVGDSVYGIFPNAKGRILADAFIFHADDQRFLLDVSADIVEKLLGHLNPYALLSEVTVKPRSEKEMISILDENISGGFSISRKGFRENRIWTDLDHKTETLKKSGAAEINPEVYEIILAQHGIPKLGREMDETIFPQEVGLEEALNFKKGCFIGAEVLQRIHYQGHVNRCLVLFESDEELRLGAPILQKKVEVGKVTFAFKNPETLKPTALGLIKTASLETLEPPLKLIRAFIPAKKS